MCTFIRPYHISCQWKHMSLPPASPAAKGCPLHLEIKHRTPSSYALPWLQREKRDTRVSVQRREEPPQTSAYRTVVEDRVPEWKGAGGRRLEGDGWRWMGLWRPQSRPFPPEGHGLAQPPPIVEKGGLAINPATVENMKWFLEITY